MEMGKRTDSLHRVELDWLISHKTVEYAMLVLNGGIEEYYKINYKYSPLDD